MKPKATYYDTVLNCKELVPISVIAKDYGKSAIWLNRYLHEKKVQYRKGNIWLIYQRYANNGYASTKTDIITDNNGNPHVRQHLCWTQKGRLFIVFSSIIFSDGELTAISVAGTAEAPNQTL